MGFLTKKKTVVDMQFVELFTPDAAYRQAKMETFFTTDNMGEYNKAMFQWKKDYRGRYRENYLERAGFEPDTVATNLIIDKNLLLAYMKTKWPLIDKIISYRTMLPSLDYVARYYLQHGGYDWTNNNDTLIFGSIEYELVDIDYSDPEDDTKITMYFEDKLNSATKHEIDLINNFHATTCLNVKYEMSTDSDWYVYIEDKSTVPLTIYTEDDMTMTAIIPVKEDNEMAQDTLWTSRMMNKLGLGGREFAGQIEEEANMDNAYIFTGLKFNDDNEYMAKALYKTFDYFREYQESITEENPIVDPDNPWYFPTAAKSSINFTMSKMNLGYGFDVNIETKDGQATRTYSTLDELGEVVEITEDLKIGQYSSTLDSAGSASTLTLRWQIAPNTYNEMIISDYINTFTISGFSFTAYLDSDEEEGRLIIPLDIMNGLKFREFIAVHDRSFTMLAYSHQVVKIYWYQQSWFSWLIRASIWWFTGGSGAALADAVIDALVNYAIALAINELLSMIDNDIIRLIATIAVAGLQASLNDMDMADFTVENYLPLATKAINSASNIYAESIAAEMKDIKEQTEEQKERDELLEAEMASHNLDVTKAMMDAHYSYGSVNSPDAWVAQQLGFGLFNYDQFYSVTTQLDTRVNVVSG